MVLRTVLDDCETNFAKIKHHSFTELLNHVHMHWTSERPTHCCQFCRNVVETTVRCISRRTRVQRHQSGERLWQPVHNPGRQQGFEVLFPNWTAAELCSWQPCLCDV